jgi:hypothetical protein
VDVALRLFFVGLNEGRESKEGREEVFNSSFVCVISLAYK